eukprot:Filipodium_phascolosomae@DN2809_c1_g1_i14.p3
MVEITMAEVMEEATTEAVMEPVMAATVSDTAESVLEGLATVGEVPSDAGMAEVDIVEEELGTEVVLDIEGAAMEQVDWEPVGSEIEIQNEVNVKTFNGLSRYLYQNTIPCTLR